jgi:uncharacterized protein (TIGR02268 family)
MRALSSGANYEPTSLPSRMGSARFPASMMTRMQKAVLLALLAVSTTARAHPTPIQQKYSSVHRAIFLTKKPASKVPEIYVAGGVVSTLRFETPCDPSRTKLLGWEGRFEPLRADGRSVSLVPLKDLDPEDRFLLLVTLMDGTELPFTIMASATRRDMQVDVYPDPDSPEAVRVTLEEQRKENKLLRAEIRRQSDEIRGISEAIASGDRALAVLLANGEISLTRFKELHKQMLRDEGVEVLVSTLVPTEKLAKRKVAMVFQVTNRHPEKPWRVQTARVSALVTDESMPFAFYGWPDEIAPGQTGRIALVADLSSFDPVKDGDKLAFELFWNGGDQQTYVVWEAKDLSP